MTINLHRSWWDWLAEYSAGQSSFKVSYYVVLFDSTGFKKSPLKSNHQTDYKIKILLHKFCVATITTYWQWTFVHTLYLISQNTFFFFTFVFFFFFQSSEKRPVPVFTHKPFHTQYTLSHTLLVSNTCMNHRQLTPSLNERHASVGNRIKARFVPFLFWTKHTKSSVCLLRGDNGVFCLYLIGSVIVPLSIYFVRLFVCTTWCWVTFFKFPYCLIYGF